MGTEPWKRITVSGLNLTAEVATIAWERTLLSMSMADPLRRYMSDLFRRYIKRREFPVILDEGMVFDSQEGPYTIGSFIPDANPAL